MRDYLIGYVNKAYWSNAGLHSIYRSSFFSLSIVICDKWVNIYSNGISCEHNRFDECSIDVILSVGAKKYINKCRKKVSILSLHLQKKNTSFCRTVLSIEIIVKVTSNDNEFRKWRWWCDKMCVVSWNHPQLDHWNSIWLRNFRRSMPFEWN